MEHKQQQQVGSVSLVGAGPGDPDLITRKGLRCLQTADVVVYDRLINTELLDEVPYAAGRVFVGKQAGCHYVKQETINELLIDYARQGKHVVRLKGGDPFVFGRGGEEVLALAQAGIPFEVIPGVSSAIAVPACAGIPVTHRQLASSVTIVTGHGHRDKTCRRCGLGGAGESRRYPGYFDGSRGADRNYNTPACRGTGVPNSRGDDLARHHAATARRNRHAENDCVASKGSLPSRRPQSR